MSPLAVGCDKAHDVWSALKPLIPTALSAVAGLALWSSPAHGACTGEACDDLAFSSDGCEITNKGHRPITLEIDIRTSGSERIDDRPTIKLRLVPMRPVSLAQHGGCPPPNSDQFVIALHFGQMPADNGEIKVKPEDMFGPAKERCSGDACGRVELIESGGCTWLQSF